ncbi:MAG: PadR family transcriptional regulator [Gemmatimonadota bacterium]|nr:MAG: PadR family transcriptional regulator [Gemmatimonadota bacterium]
MLRALERGGPMHGYGISVLIRQWSDEMLRVEQGSLYPALYRLEEQGWVHTAWGTSENNRRAKFYSVTREGLEQLQVEREQWRRLSGGVNLVLQEV